VLIIGSGQWANKLLERYSTLTDLNISQISFQQSLLLTTRNLVDNDLCVLASRPQNNFQLLLSHNDPKANYLVEKPLVFDQESRNYFSTKPSKARILVNYQYSSTSAWSHFIETFTREMSNPISVSISNLGPATRDYISPALDYGSHVLALAIEFRSILGIVEQGFEFVDYQGDQSWQEIKLLLDKVELKLEYGFHKERISKIELKSKSQHKIFYFSGKHRNFRPEPILTGLKEPILQTLEGALYPATKYYIHTIQESVEIFDIYQRVINS